MAAVSVFAGTDASAAKHVDNTTVAVHAVAVPHLQVEAVQIFVKAGPHAAVDPHIQVPASQESALPVQSITLHGSKTD